MFEQMERIVSATWVQGAESDRTNAGVLFRWTIRLEKQSPYK